jgi:coenzyme F420-reducing hydrogenase delta subunit
MISGCMPEQCHFKTGNMAARRQLEEFNDFLDHIGYEKQRVRFVWLDLQDRGIIQKQLARFEQDLEALGPATNLVTRVKVAEGEFHA